MIRHIVMWRFKEENKEENIAKFSKDLLALKGVIEQIKHMEIGRSDLIASEYDMVLISDFESYESLNEYRIHPFHKKVSAFCKKIREIRAAIDYEY